MLASVWDWPSLQYLYFVLEKPLDAGGFHPSKGIHKKDHKASEKSFTLEECLPQLPDNAFFAGIGEDCVGELYSKVDSRSRPKIDVEKMFREGTPSQKKAAQLLLNHVPIRENSLGATPKSKAESGSTNEVVYVASDKIIWEKLVPVVTSLGLGYGIYRLSEKNLKMRDVLLSWTAGLAIGITVGQQSFKQDKLRKVKK